MNGSTLDGADNNNQMTSGETPATDPTGQLSRYDPEGGFTNENPPPPEIWRAMGPSSASPADAANRASLHLHILDAGQRHTYRVVSVKGAEELSRLYRFSVRFATPLNDEDDDAYLRDGNMLGLTGVIEIETRQGPRNISGIVRRCTRLRSGRNAVYYRAEIVPLMWYLTRRRGARVFTPARCNASSITMPDLLRSVIEQHALLPDTSYRYEATSERTHNFVAQYQETEWNFLCRLMEADGMFYWFRHHREAPATLVISDSNNSSSQSSLHPDLPYRQADERSGTEDYVYDLSETYQVRQGAMAVDEYDFERGPGVERLARREADRFTNLESFEYPVPLVEDGEWDTKFRLERALCRRHVVTMRTSAPGLAAGEWFNLVDHPVQRFNQAWLVVRVEHTVTVQQAVDREQALNGRRYEARIWAIPLEVAYRAPRRARRPRVIGAQTAIVVGPRDEEIHTDQHGRVRVQFHWDREGTFTTDSSHWIRVSQGLAGGQYGIQFLPRVGQEVVVEFLDGDPSRPIITGRVYNGDQRPPYSLPQERHISTIKTQSYPNGGGCNELRFDDKKGQEQLLLHAEKELHLRSRAGTKHSVGGSRSDAIGGSHFTSVRRDQHLKVGGKQIVEVEQDRSVVTSGSTVEYTRGERSVVVQERHQIHSQQETVIISDGPLKLKGPGGFIRIDEGGIQIQSNTGAQVRVNCGDTDRIVMSPFMEGRGVRPAEGPASADRSTPGYDMRYHADSVGTSGYRRSVSGHGNGDPVRPWVAIRLAAEDGTPAAGERYEVLEPSGRRITGRLDDQGEARVETTEPGECQVSFPDLDSQSWSRS